MDPSGNAMPESQLQPRPQLIAWIQGVYFAATGLWPLLSIETFQAVTGPKTDHLPTGSEADHWLVNSVGVLVLSIGLTLLIAAWRRNGSIEIAVLGISSALALTAIDVIYVLRGTIAPIYLGDAAIEVALIAGWCVSLLRRLS